MNKVILRQKNYVHEIRKAPNRYSASETCDKTSYFNHRYEMYNNNLDNCVITMYDLQLEDVFTKINHFVNVRITIVFRDK